MRGRHTQGFTLVELLVVIVIIAVLAAIALPRFKDIRNKAKNAQTATNLQQIQRALEQFAVDNGGMYPFRVNHYEDPQVSLPGFDPYDRENFPPSIHSEPARPWFSLGLFGGVKVVTHDWLDNTQPGQGNSDSGPRHGGLIQPFAPGWNYGNTYRFFNQYTDPLVAGGYLGEYPQNPFMRRPMGAILYGYGEDSNGQPNRTVPYEAVVPSPGDFVYSHFYRLRDGDLVEPEGVVIAKKSYTIEIPGSIRQQHYYLDLVDSYQLWAYGDLPLNGGQYVAYPNNFQNLSNGNRQPRRDWDNSGTRDMFETGLTAYFRSTSGGAIGAQKDGGGKLEF